jgi:plasmid maintenance system antidote protein VapI
MALRLSRAFDTTPDLWLNLQKNYDLWSAEKASKEWKKVKPIPIYLLHSKAEIISEQNAGVDRGLLSDSPKFWF